MDLGYSMCQLNPSPQAWTPEDLETFVSSICMEVISLGVQIVGGFKNSPAESHKDLDLLVPKENVKSLVFLLKRYGFVREGRVNTRYGWSTQMYLDCDEDRYCLDIFEE